MSQVRVGRRGACFLVLLYLSGAAAMSLVAASKASKSSMKIRASCVACVSVAMATAAGAGDVGDATCGIFTGHASGEITIDTATASAQELWYSVVGTPIDPDNSDPLAERGDYTTANPTASVPNRTVQCTTCTRCACVARRARPARRRKRDDVRAMSAMVAPETVHALLLKPDSRATTLDTLESQQTIDTTLALAAAPVLA